MACGDQTLSQKIPEKDEDSITPVRGLREYCKVHTEEAINLFCNRCQRPVCPLCMDKSHQGHDVVSLKSAIDTLQKSLHQCVKEAKDKNKEMADNTSDLQKQLQKTQKQEKDTDEKDKRKHEKNIQDIEQEYRKKLQEIERAREESLQNEAQIYKSGCQDAQKRFEEKKGKLQGGIQLGNAESMNIDNLITHLQRTSSYFSLEGAQDAVMKTRAALKKIRPFRLAPSIEEIKKKLPRLMKKLQADVKISPENVEDPVVITSQCLADLQHFTSGKLSEFPGPLKGPDAAAVHKVEDIKVISEATSIAAEDLLGEAALPNYTGREGYSVLTDGKNNATHVIVGLKHALHPNIVNWWYLPAGMRLRQALKLAVGDVGIKLIERLEGHRAMEDNTFAWWSSSDTKIFRTFLPVL